MSRQTRSDKGQERPQNSRANSPAFLAAMAKRRGTGRPIGSIRMIYNHGIPYLQIKTGPTKTEWVKLHRFIMEQHLCRALDPQEHIHHINGDSLDNRIENLMLVNNNNHRRFSFSRYVKKMEFQV